MTRRHPLSHPHHADSNAQIVAEAERERNHPDIKLTAPERASIAKIVAAGRALKKLPEVRPTSAEKEAKIRHRRTIQKEVAEVNESLGVPHGRAAIKQAEKEVPPGIDVAEIADALRALRVPNMGAMGEHLAPPAHRKTSRRGA